jgi:putative ABC transport system ATP-binding protein
MSILELEGIRYSYDGHVNVLKNINYSFDMGKVYAIVGRSGAGKTTLLSLLSGLATPSDGQIKFEGKSIGTIDRYELRSRHVGVIFQSYNLLPHLTAVENVELSMRASGKKIDNRRQRAMELLDKVGIYETLAKRKILHLSGGEQQRVAIARALSFDPSIILADEPTGNLDPLTQQEILDIFLKLAHEEEKCVIIVSHSPEVAKSVDEVYRLEKPKKH